jgi:hypothetical protein
MLNNKLSIASLIMLSAWGSLYAAEPAGRVLILQGSAVAVRGAQEIPLARGTTIESGDLLKVADSSSMQVRFTDESVVALRANSQYKIDDYKFSEKGEGDKSVFSLLKGGMRTITGLIGKRNPENYQMRSTTATIGIRGTHFTAVNCASDCTNTDGSKVEDGLYGGVTDGRIVVRNSAGETEFSRDQYFQVTSNNALPIPLLAPPSFLRDKLDGLAKAGKGSTGKTAEVQVSGSSSIMETRSPAPTSFAAAPSTRSAQTTYQPMNNPVVAQAAAATATDLKISTPVLLASLLPNIPLVSVPVVIPVDPAITQPATVIPVAPVTPVAPVVTQPAVVPANSTLISGTWSDAYVEASTSRFIGNGEILFWANTYGASSDVGTATNYPLPANFVYTPLNWYMNFFGPWTTTGVDSSGTAFTATYTKSGSEDTGSYAGVADTAYWGRYSLSIDHGTSTAPENTTEIVHWILGAPVTAAPTSGIFTFNHVGGTQPTDSAGKVGTLTNGGSWTVNFGTRTIASVTPVTWTMPNGASYSASISATNPASLVAFGPKTSTDTATNGGTYTSVESGVNSITRTGTSGGSCSGNGCTMTNVVFSPQFGGANATGLGVGIATTATTTTGTQYTAQVRAYTR